MIEQQRGSGVQMAKRKGGEAAVFPTMHEFNGKTKELMRLINSPSTIKAYKELLKELRCEPSEVGRKLRERVWKGKSPRDILEELDEG